METLLIERLKSSDPLILDGAMGTELSKRGCEGGGECCLTNPETVAAIHNDYIGAGSKAIITNTLTMNRLYIETHNLGIDVGKVNLAGAKIALDAMGQNGYVLGNLSSTGQLLEPYGTYLEEEFVDCFKEQARYLAEGGVSGFIIETVIDLREALCAVKACKAVSSLPVIACISYFTRSDGGRTAMGNTAEECARTLTEEGADAIGANCGSIDPEQMAEVAGILRKATRLPVVTEPNAGKPRLDGNRTFFDMDPATFASGLKKCMEAGAQILGGCCGTTPEHIRALAKVIGS